MLCAVCVRRSTLEFKLSLGLYKHMVNVMESWWDTLYAHPSTSSIEVLWCYNIMLLPSFLLTKGQLVST